MTVWVLILVSFYSKQIFVNTFDSKIKCEQRIEKMEKIYQFSCMKTTLNPDYKSQACRQCRSHYGLGVADIKAGKTNGMGIERATKLAEDGLTSCLDFHTCDN